MNFKTSHCEGRIGFCRFVKLRALFPGTSIKGSFVLIQEPVSASLAARCLLFLACDRVLLANGASISGFVVWE